METVQGNFRVTCRRELPSAILVHDWLRQFKETRSLFK